MTALWRNTDLASWWKDIKQAFNPHQENSKTYEDAAKFFLFQMFLQDDIYNDAQLVKQSEERIDSLSKPHVLLSYTRTQFNLLESDNARKVALTSLFGTGKTILLIERAKKLEEQIQLKKEEANEKIIFIVVEKNKGESLLKRKLSQLLSDSPLIELENVQGKFLTHLFSKVRN